MITNVRLKSSITRLTERLNHGKELSGVVENVKLAYGTETDSRRKQQLLGLVSSHLTGAQLRKRGWAVSRSEIKRSRRPIRVPRLPPNCKPLSAQTREAIQTFYLDHCQPAGDKTCYDKTTKSHVTVMVHPYTTKQLHRELPEDLRVSYSTFAKLRPINVRQAKRKTDMCEVCVAGHACEAECERVAKRLKTTDDGAAHEGMKLLMSSTQKTKSLTTRQDPMPTSSGTNSWKRTSRCSGHTSGWPNSNATTTRRRSPL
jgi:hypothetical protein